LWAVLSTPVGARRAYRVATTSSAAAVDHHAVANSSTSLTASRSERGTTCPCCTQPTDHPIRLPSTHPQHRSVKQCTPRVSVGRTLQYVEFRDTEKLCTSTYSAYKPLQPACRSTRVPTIYRCCCPAGRLLDECSDLSVPWLQRG